MEFIALLCFVAVGWLLQSPFFVFSLWGRVREMEESVKRLQNEARSRIEPTLEPPVLSAKAASTYVTPQVRAASHTSDEVPLDELLASSSAVGAEAHATSAPPPRTLTEAKAKQRGMLAKSVPNESENVVGGVTPLAMADDGGERKAEERTGRSPHPTSQATRSAAATKPLTGDESSTLEEILAGKWLTWVGALAVIIGAGFGFK